MDELMGYSLSPEEKKKYMEDFLPHLASLRAKAGISQEELSNMVGISRQTYGGVERNLKDLTWNTFLSLLLFFDYNTQTHDILHSSGAFPDKLIGRINIYDGKDQISLDEFVRFGDKDIFECMDDQALRSIKTMIMVEYARCTNTPGDAVVKAFDGMDFNLRKSNPEADHALAMIKKKKKRREQ